MIVERQAIVDHLRAEYVGVFSEEAIQRFFGDHVYYSTNAGMRRAVRRLGLRLEDQRGDTLRAPDSIRNPTVRRAVRGLGQLGLLPVTERAIRAWADDPLSPVIAIEARKP